MFKIDVNKMMAISDNLKTSDHELILELTRMSARDKAVVVGIYLSKFDKMALNEFDFSGFRQAYNVFGYSIGIVPKSIQNYRDEFDSIFPNNRKGWRNRKLRDYCGLILDKVNVLTFEDFSRIIRCFIDNKFIYNELESSFAKDAFSAQRLITGKAAEEYFEMKCREIDVFNGFELNNTTNFGCGYDYRMTCNDEYYCVEVKGLNECFGSILMTQKEYDVAEVVGDRYCLFLVKNFKKTPEHQLFFNPVRNKSLTLVRQEKMIKQVSYCSRV